jgi:effector-binding domain-containing protein
MEYDIELREIKAQHTLSVRTKCKPAEIGPILAEILRDVWKLIRKNGAFPSGPPFTRYHGYHDPETDLEAGFPVAQPLTGEGTVLAGELPGGTVAFTTHRGPYEKLPEAHDALDKWISDNGKSSSGAQWECYIDDPGKEPDPAKRRTELYWPVE